MDMMENATQRLQTGLGMRMKLTTIMKAEVTNTDCMDCKKMVSLYRINLVRMINLSIL